MSIKFKLSIRHELKTNSGITSNSLKVKFEAMIRRMTESFVDTEHAWVKI